MQTFAVVATRVRAEERMLFEALRRRALPWAHVDDRALVYRVGAPRPPWGVVLNRAVSATRRVEVSRLCEATGTPVVNSVHTLQLCDNKIATTLALHGAGLPTPRTAIALDATRGPEAAAEVGYPAVVKPVNGSWGRGVVRAADPEAAETVFALRGQLPSPMQSLAYTQEFVAGRDLRVLVVGGRALAAMTRESEHWVRNTARGARPVARTLDPELARMAEQAAAAVGGGVLGVDLLETDTGRVVLEVNGAAEFHGLAEAHPRLQIADEIVNHALTRVDR
ncbi:MAG TPA: RimK family alpha-L-glutamate ligase [Actinocrinis sp.]|nr:RimK family alpha-L-glutamate ligase [Actinocrinis sp.]